MGGQIKRKNREGKMNGNESGPEICQYLQWIHLMND